MESVLAQERLSGLGFFYSFALDVAFSTGEFQTSGVTSS